MKYLLDTNIISETIKSKPDKNVLNWFAEVENNDLFISVLTLGEIRAEVEKITEQNRRNKLLKWLENDLLNWFGDRLLPIDSYVADRWGKLQSMAKRTLPAVDSLLAATALAYELKLVTRNTKDYHFPFLEVINPFLHSKVN